MEKQVVATDVGGVRELVGNEGYLVPPRDPAALAAAMGEAMETNVSIKVARCREARQRICAYFNMDAKPVEWENLYTQALSSNG